MWKINYINVENLITHLIKLFIRFEFRSQEPSSNLMDALIRVDEEEVQSVLHIDSSFSLKKLPQSPKIKIS